MASQDLGQHRGTQKMFDVLVVSLLNTSPKRVPSLNKDKSILYIYIHCGHGDGVLKILVHFLERQRFPAGFPSTKRRPESHFEKLPSGPKMDGFLLASLQTDPFLKCT